MTANRTIRTAALAAGMAALISVSHCPLMDVPAGAGSNDQAASPDAFVTTGILQSRMTGKRQRMTRPVRRKMRVVKRRPPRRQRATDLDHVGAYNFKYEISKGAPRASGRRNELDHMGAYNFIVDVE